MFSTPLLTSKEVTRVPVGNNTKFQTSRAARPGVQELSTLLLIFETKCIHFRSPQIPDICRYCCVAMESTRWSTRAERAQRRALKRDNRGGNIVANMEEGARGDVEEVRRR